MEVFATTPNITNEAESGKSDTMDTSVMDGLLDNLNLDKLQQNISKNEETKNISFLDLMKKLMSEDHGNSIEQAGDYVGNLLFQEIRQNKHFLIIIIALAAAFALIKNFSNIFHNSYISELCFMLIYIELMILLMKSFLVVNELLSGTLGKVVDFMKALLPVFCMM
jgi:stage III sporulation protein AE